MNIYKYGEVKLVDLPILAEFPGDCFGIVLFDRGEGHTPMALLLIEDDEIWYPKEYFSAHWLSDLSSVLAKAEIFMKGLNK